MSAKGKTGGRPPGSDARDIARVLQDEARAFLKQGSHLELTARKLAERAGVHPNMVRYYYGSMDKLFASLVDELIETADRRLEAFEARLSEVDDPTRGLIHAMAGAYLPEWPTSSIMLIESMRPNSPFMAHYDDRQRWRLFHRVQAIITACIASGRYRADLDPFHATFNLLSLVAGPLAIGRLEMADGGIAPLDVAKWEDEVVALIDRGFRA